MDEFQGFLTSLTVILFIFIIYFGIPGRLGHYPKKVNLHSSKGWKGFSNLCKLSFKWNYLGCPSNFILRVTVYFHCRKEILTIWNANVSNSGNKRAVQPSTTFIAMNLMTKCCRNICCKCWCQHLQPNVSLPELNDDLQSYNKKQLYILSIYNAKSLS